VPASSLPRPDASAATAAAPRLQRASGPRHREHHVTTDYSYVHRDLLAVAGIGTVVIAFIVAMSFVL
jgi:hypothetical protein